jgi:hypothetical protein
VCENYVRAKWMRRQAAANMSAAPFSDEQYKSFKMEWRLSERLPDGAKARRLEPEKPSVMQWYFDGVDETVGIETVHHHGLSEVLGWPCHMREVARGGEARSFADYLAAGKERMGGADESCLMRAAKELKGVGPTGGSGVSQGQRRTPRLRHCVGNHWRVRCILQALLHQEGVGLDRGSHGGKTERAELSSAAQPCFVHDGWWHSGNCTDAAGTGDEGHQATPLPPPPRRPRLAP